MSKNLEERNRILNEIISESYEECNISDKERLNKRLVVNYKILRVLGCVPFIWVLYFSIYRAMTGSWFTLDIEDYGIEAIFLNILLFSSVFWPIYIIGLILIAISFYIKSKIENINCKVCDKKIPYNKNNLCHKCHKKVLRKLKEKSNKG